MEGETNQAEFDEMVNGLYEDALEDETFELIPIE